MWSFKDLYLHCMCFTWHCRPCFKNTDVAKASSFIYPLIWSPPIERHAVEIPQWPITLVWIREILVPPIHHFYQDDQIRESLLLEWGLSGHNKTIISHIPCVLQVHLKSGQIFKAAVSIFLQLFNSRLLSIQFQHCLTHTQTNRDLN